MIERSRPNFKDRADRSRNSAVHPFLKFLSRPINKRIAITVDEVLLGIDSFLLGTERRAFARIARKHVHVPSLTKVKCEGKASPQNEPQLLQPRGSRACGQETRVHDQPRAD